MNMSRRFAQLVLGLLLFGFTMGVMVQSGIGLPPWDVLHQGLAQHLPLTFGQVVIAVGALVLLAWIPLRQRPGVGTVLNVLLVGLAADAGVALVPEAHVPVHQVALMAAGIVGNGVAGALYIGARLGSGPRDGLWVGLVARTGGSVRVIRTAVEASVLVLGVVLGGTVGLGTVLYAFGIGPLVQVFLPHVDHAPTSRPAKAPGPVVPAGTEYVSWLVAHPVDNLVG